MQTAAPTSVPELLRALFGSEPFFGGQSAGLQGDGTRHIFMIAVVSLVSHPARPVKLLEVGSWVGSSTLSFAQAIRRFSPAGGTITCVDSWTPYLTDRDIVKGGWYSTMNALLEIDLAFSLFKHNTQTINGEVALRSIRGISGTILPTLEPASYDLIYIDASHYYSDVLNDLRCAARLLRDGGILCGDDLELQVESIDIAAARDRLKEDFVVDPATGREFHPGVTLAVGEFFGRTISSVIGFWAVRKNGEYFEDVSFEGLPSVVPSHLPEAQKTAAQTFLTGSPR